MGSMSFIQLFIKKTNVLHVLTFSWTCTVNTWLYLQKQCVIFISQHHKMLTFPFAQSCRRTQNYFPLRANAARSCSYHWWMMNKITQKTRFMKTLILCNHDIMNQDFQCSCPYDSLTITKQFCFIYRESASEVPDSQPHSSVKNNRHLCRAPKGPPYEDIDRELLQQQKNQSATLEHGLQSIAQEVRSVSSVVLRWDSQAIVVHTRQLVSTISGLTMAINVLTRWDTGSREDILFQWPLNCAAGNGEGG